VWQTDGQTDGRTPRRWQRRAKHSAFARNNQHCQLRDHLIHHQCFTIKGPSSPRVYLAQIRRYGASKIMGSRVWPFGVTWRHRSRDHSTPGGLTSYGWSNRTRMNLKVILKGQDHNFFVLQLPVNAWTCTLTTCRSLINISHKSKVRMTWAFVRYSAHNTVATCEQYFALRKTW